MPLVAPPRYNWSSVTTGTGVTGATCCGTGNFTGMLSDNSDGNDWNCGGNGSARLYVIAWDVTKPDGSTIRVMDWIPGGPVGDVCVENTYSYTGCFTADQVGTYNYSFTCMDARPWFTTDGYGSFYIGASWYYLTVPNPTGFYNNGSDIRNYYTARHSDTGPRADTGFRNAGTDISQYFQPGGNGNDTGFRSGGSSLGSLFA